MRSTDRKSKQPHNNVPHVPHSLNRRNPPNKAQFQKRVQITAASVMLVNGVPLKVVSEILGHSSISITGDIYGHVAPEVSRDALDKLSFALDA